MIITITAVPKAKERATMTPTPIARSISVASPRPEPGPSLARSISGTSPRPEPGPSLAKSGRFPSTRRRLSVTLAGLIAGGLATAFTLAAPTDAEAAVRGGPNGIEFEGAQDRRGVYVGPGVFFGFSGMKGTIVPDVGLNLAFGGGVSKRVLLGINLHAAKYLGRAEGASSWMFGGDFEFTGYAWQGLYLRTGLGGVGLPAGDPNNTLVAGIGGNVGVGYEFWLNATAAASVGITYDLRYLAGEPELVPAPLRHSGMVGMRFVFF